MTSACFSSHPVAHSVCLLLPPGLLETLLLLFAWRQSHVSRWVFFMSCVFELKTPGHRIPHCLTEQQVQLSHRAHPFVVCGRVRLHSLHYSQNGCIFSWRNKGYRGEHGDLPIIHRLHVVVLLIHNVIIRDGIISLLLPPGMYITSKPNILLMQHWLSKANSADKLLHCCISKCKALSLYLIGIDFC